MATIGSAKATLVDKIDSLTASATAKDTIYLAKALKENTTHHSFTYLGAWAATTAYAVDDVVITGGQTYICILSHVAPGSFVVGAHWDLLASKGTNGIDGASGIPSGGSVGQVVTNTGAGAGGWADVAAGGKVLQMVYSQGANTGAVQTTGVFDGLSVSITPQQSGSKLIISPINTMIQNSSSGTDIQVRHNTNGMHGGRSFGYLDGNANMYPGKSSQIIHVTTASEVGVSQTFDVHINNGQVQSHSGGFHSIVVIEYGV
jgi:hypothetical protein